MSDRLYSYFDTTYSATAISQVDLVSSLYADAGGLMLCVRVSTRTLDAVPARGLLNCYY